MGRKVGCYVHVDGAVFGPGDEPGPEFERLIRNPACWEDGRAPAEGPPVPSGEGDGSSGDDSSSDGPVPGPPRSGRGSGLPVWVDFAADHGIATVDAEGEPLSRDELIDACVAAKVIEPEAP